MTENAKAYMLKWAFSLSLEQCRVMAARWLAHYALYDLPVRELTLEQNELCAFAVGVMLERIYTE